MAQLWGVGRTKIGLYSSAVGASVGLVLQKHLVPYFRLGIQTAHLDLGP